MKSVFVWIAIGVGCLVSIFGLNYFGYMNIAFFAPKIEAVRRDVMIESRAYSEATVRELYRLHRQYNASDDEVVRMTIVAAARHEFSIFPEDRLPPDLRVWMQQIR